MEITRYPSLSEVKSAERIAIRDEHPRHNILHSDEFLTANETAALCGIGRQFLTNHRDDGFGPPYQIRGGRLGYLRQDVMSWINSQRVAAE